MGFSDLGGSNPFPLFNFIFHILFFLFGILIELGIGFCEEDFVNL